MRRAWSNPLDMPPYVELPQVSTEPSVRSTAKAPSVVATLLMPYVRSAAPEPLASSTVAPEPKVQSEPEEVTSAYPPRLSADTELTETLPSMALITW